MIDLNKINTSDILEELKKYCTLDGPDETTEALTLLISLYDYPDYISKELYKEIENELKSSYLRYKNDSIICEEKETFTKTFQYLEWR